MAGGELSGRYFFLQRLAEREKPQRVRHRGARFLHTRGDLLLRETVIVHELFIARGLFHGVQILALEVFHERELHGELIVRLQNAHRHFLESCGARRPPAALAGDDLIVTLVERTHRDGLDQPVFADGRSQLLDRRGVKLPARLILARLDPRDRQGLHRFVFEDVFLLAEQGGKPGPKP